jgi:uncharacterized membrane protein
LSREIGIQWIPVRRKTNAIKQRKRAKSDSIETGLALERDEEKWERFSAASRSNQKESITFMISDRTDPKSS